MGLSVGVVPPSAILPNASVPTCLTLLSEQLFSAARRLPLVTTEAADVILIGLDTYVQSTWPTGKCHRSGSVGWARSSSICEDCNTSPWLDVASDSIESWLGRRRAAQQQTQPNVERACKPTVIAFAPIISGPDEQHGHPRLLRRFFQHDLCVVRLLGDAVHGVYRQGVDISFPSQLKPHIGRTYGTFAPLRGPKAHLLGFQGSTLASRELATPIALHHMRFFREEAIRILKSDDKQDEMALRVVPKSTSAMQEAHNSACPFVDAMNSTFCLVLRGSSCYTWRLLECLFFGSIPVIVADEMVLPFSELLNWDTFAVRWAWPQIHLLPAHLRALRQSAGRVESMQRRGQQVWRRHFRGPDEHMATVIQILERRRFTAAR